MSSFPFPVGRGRRIYRLHLCREARSLKEYPVYDTKQSDGKVPVIVEILGVPSTPSLPLHSGSWWPAVVGPIYRSNKPVWHLNSEQTNYSCQVELLEIELFEHLIVYKQMGGFIELLGIHSKIWNYSTLLTHVYKSYISNIYV